jgi:outer membrane protein OmpA-like peptidoglycan-associated protein
MRVSWVLALVAVACAAVDAQGADQPQDPTSVTVNLDALPVPMPRAKPSPDEMRPLAQARPRPKPSFDESIGASVAEVPLPRLKPAVDDISVAPLVPAPAAVTAERVAAPPRSMAPEVPVEIVDGVPTTDDSIGVEITGVAHDPFKKPVNPLEGFAVLSRVRFKSGVVDVSAQARDALDALAQRLLTSRERVRLAAFSGRRGDLSSEARRLSLARALAVRAYLVSKGVPVERVDVLAFGGPTEGFSDRVDVLVRGI